MSLQKVVCIHHVLWCKNMEVAIHFIARLQWDLENHEQPGLVKQFANLIKPETKLPSRVVYHTVHPSNWGTKMQPTLGFTQYLPSVAPNE